MKKLLSLISIMTLGISLSWAYDFSAVNGLGQTLYYSISSNNTVTVTYPNFNESHADYWYSHTKPSGVLEIPATVSFNETQYTVTSIGSNAFTLCSELTSVTIPSTITSIGSYAFYACSGLTDVVFPNTITNIGNYAFSGCIGLINVFIPNSVTSIGNYAFYLVGHISYHGSASGSPWGATAINEFDFQSISPSGHTLYYNIIQGTNSVEVTCPGNQFDMNPWNGFTQPSGSLIIPSFVSFQENTYPVSRIGEVAFRSCTSIQHVDIPNSVIVINNNAFENCSNLQEVTVHRIIEQIGSHAFKNCSNLSRLNYQADSCFGVGACINNFNGCFHCSFEGCNNLQTIVIGSNVRYIPERAFSCCSSVDSIVVLSPMPPVISANTFGISNNALCYVPINSLPFYQASPFWNSMNLMGFQNEDTSYSATINAGEGGHYIVLNQSIGGENAIEVVAIPYHGYCFQQWSTRDTANPLQFTYFSDTTLTCYFSHTLTDTIYMNVHDTTYIDIHDTTIVHDTIFVPVHDTTVVHDTTFVSVHDTTIITVHDTTFVTVHDTTFVTVHDTTFIPVHDTTFVTVHDTTFVTVHDTTFITVHDTTFVPVHDTTFISVHDTSFITVHDTTFITMHDTSFITVHDTSFITVHDTTFITMHDTTFVTVYDTTIVHDTTIITVTDTIVQPITYYDLSVISGNVSQGLVAGNGHFPEGTAVEIAAIPMEGYRFVQWHDGNTDNPRVVEMSGNATYVASFDASTEAIGNVDNQEFIITTDKGSITIQGAAHKRIRIFDCLGRLLTTEMNTAEYKTFMVPASGAYLVQIGNHPAKRVVVIR